MSSTCWLWAGNKTSSGYGITKDKQPAHRAVYEAMAGPIGEGLQLHHTCEERLCVNPRHLQPLTHAQHRAIHAELRPACKRGHPWTHVYKNVRRCRTCLAENARRRRARVKALALG